MNLAACRNRAEWPEGKCRYLQFSEHCNFWMCTLNGMDKPLDAVGVCQWKYGRFRHLNRQGKLWPPQYPE